jgi:predicted HTH domain antitoxin
VSTTELRVALPTAVSEEEAKLSLAMSLYEAHKISLGQAAKMAGFSKRAFMELLGRHSIAVFDYPAEELRRETE